MYQSVTNAISVKPGVAFFYFIQINSAMPDIINSIFQTSTVGQPFDFQADMDFVMYGRRDETALIIESLLGANYDNTKTYILKGCDVSSDGTTTTVTPGYIFGINKVWGNLVARTYAYFHPGSSFPDPTGGNVVVCTATVTYPAGDPITFTDSSTHNVHMIINVTFSAGASGSGDVDYSALLFYNVGWTNVASFGTQWAAAPNAARYRRDNFNVVRLESAAITTGTTPTSLIMTLPVGFRPSGTISPVGVLFDFGTVTYSPVVFKILASGQVSFENTADVPVSTNCAAIFSGITFTTD